MNRQELKDLRIGDVVVISARGSKNVGKRGIVKDIYRIDGGGNIGVEPLDCLFEFSKGQEKTCIDGSYWYSHYAVRLDGKEAKEPVKPIVKKCFYMVPVLCKKPITWSADNFTEKELLVIARFVDELKDHASYVQVTDILILDKEGLL